MDKTSKAFLRGLISGALIVLFLVKFVPSVFNNFHDEKARRNPTPTVVRVYSTEIQSAVTLPATPAYTPATFDTINDTLHTATVSPMPVTKPANLLSPTPTLMPTKKIEADGGATEFKSYMSWLAITSKSSPQWAFQQQAVTGDYGIRTVDGRYCVALGSYWARTIGTKLDVYMVSGEVLHCVLGDCKADKDTDRSHQYGKPKGDVLEFIVDTHEIPDNVRKTGSFNCIFPGMVSHIEVLSD